MARKRSDKPPPLPFDIDRALSTGAPPPPEPMDVLTLEAPNLVIPIAEFARLRGVRRETVRSWIRLGKVSATRTPGGHWRIPVSELRNFPLSVGQIATRIGVGRQTIRRWCESGKVRATKAYGDPWRVDPSEVARLTPLAQPRIYPEGWPVRYPDNPTGRSRGVRLAPTPADTCVRTQTPDGNRPVTSAGSADSTDASSPPPSRESAQNPGKSTPAQPRPRKPRPDEEFAGPARVSKRTTRTRIPAKRKDQR